MDDFDGFEIPVYYGGPVQKDSIHFLHQCPELIPDSMEVIKGIYWGGNFEAVAALIKNNQIELSKIRFFLGYSGWGDGQLTDEMDKNSWLTVNATPGLVFHKQVDEIWKECLKALGGEYEMMINFPIDPQLN
jgi:putative transcriptional regulator